ncbi:MAG: hypothetical protein U5K27_06075 [Desulfotignum sp.]|nr:hypothetical protein [Desulfotignum sp.]
MIETIGGDGGTLAVDDYSLVIPQGLFTRPRSICRFTKWVKAGVWKQT